MTVSRSTVGRGDVAPVRSDLIDENAGSRLVILDLRGLEKEEALLELLEIRVNCVSLYRRERHFIIVHIIIYMNEPCV